MNKIQFRANHIDPNSKFLTFQPRNNSRQYNKSKSTKKNHLNKNILSPCQPLGDKLLKAALQKNQEKKIGNHRQKTEQSLLQTSMSLQGSRCFNHPQKKGQYYLQNMPNKKFCLKCNLTLSNGNNSSFITKEKHHKKQILQKFKQQLSSLKNQIRSSQSLVIASLEMSEEKFSDHSAYINVSFKKLEELLEQKRREMINSLIIAQQGLKKVYEDNLKKVRKMTKSIERYELDIKKFYDEIIEELPKAEFDKIMEEYEDRINKNFRSKLKNILTQDGICIYIPNLELKNTLERANVDFYQPLSLNQSKTNLHLSFQREIPETGNERTASNSLDSKINDMNPGTGKDCKKPSDYRIDLRLPERKKQIDLKLFEKKTQNLAQPIKMERNDYNFQDKQNVNTQNFTYSDYNSKFDPFGKFTFKS